MIFYCVRLRLPLVVNAQGASIDLIKLIVQQVQSSWSWCREDESSRAVVRYPLCCPACTAPQLVWPWAAAACSGVRTGMPALVTAGWSRLALCSCSSRTIETLPTLAEVKSGVWPRQYCSGSAPAARRVRALPMRLKATVAWSMRPAHTGRLLLGSIEVRSKSSLSSVPNLTSRSLKRPDRFSSNLRRSP